MVWWVVRLSHLVGPRRQALPLTFRIAHARDDDDADDIMEDFLRCLFFLRVFDALPYTTLSPPPPR